MSILLFTVLSKAAKPLPGCEDAVEFALIKTINMIVSLSPMWLGFDSQLGSDPGREVRRAFHLLSELPSVLGWGQ